MNGFPYNNQFQPQQFNVPQYPQYQDQLIYVHGLEGAKAHPARPNTRIVLFDMNEDIFYIKSTDFNGFPSIEEYAFRKVDGAQDIQNQPVPYVTKEELESAKEEVIKNVKQLIQTSKQSGPNNGSNKSKAE